MPARKSRKALDELDGNQVNTLQQEVAAANEKSSQLEAKNKDLEDQIAMLTQQLESSTIQTPALKVSPLLGNSLQQPTQEKAKKDKDAPLKPRTAYNLFVKEKYPMVAALNENKEKKSIEIMPILSKMWKELKEEDKLPYNTASKEDKVRYESEMAVYSEKKRVENEEKDALELYREHLKMEEAMKLYEKQQEEKEEKDSSKKKKKDIEAPKQSLSAFLYFCKEKRPEIVEKYPELSFGAVGKKLGEEWAKLQTKNKKKVAKYEKLAETDKERYTAELAEYNDRKARETQEKNEQELASAMEFYKQYKSQ